MLAQTARYFSFAAWFLKDIFLRHRGRLAGIVAANVAGIGLQALAVLAAYRYAAAVEGGRTLNVAGLAIDVRTSLALLAATAATVLVLAAVSALLVMRARTEGAKLALDCADYWARRAYSLVSRISSIPYQAPYEDLTIERFLQLTRRDGRYCAQVVRTVVYGLVHLGTMVAAGIGLVVLDPSLTLAVFAILTAAVFFLRRTSIRGASAHQRVQRYGPELHKERRALQERVLRNAAPLPADGLVLRETFGLMMTKMHEAELGQRHAIEGGKLIASIAIAFALSLVLVVQGGAALTQHGNWSGLLVYVTALIFFGNAIARVGRMLVNINRFYPALARHARFVDRAIDQYCVSPSEYVGDYVLKAPEIGKAVDPASPLRVGAGDRLALVLPGELTRYAIVPLVRSLCATGAADRHGAIAFPWFATDRLVLGPGSLRDNFGLPPSCSTNDLLALLGGKDGLAQLAFLPDFDRPLDAAERSSLTPAAVFILSVLAGLLNRSSMLVLDHAALARLDAGMRTRLLAVAAKRITLVAYRTEGVSEIGSHLESALVISTHNEILGWARVQSLISGDQAVRDAIARASGSRAPVEASLAVDEDPEDLA